MVSDGASDAMPSQITANIVEIRRGPGKATGRMNELYRIGHVDIGVSVFRFHAVFHEVWSNESIVTRDQGSELAIRKLIQIIETSLRWASVSPSMYR